MKKQQVKLVKSQNVEQQYYIFLNKKLGQGAFGEVYEARSKSENNKRLVVKSMKINGDQKKIAEIDKELKIMSELRRHENIVNVVPVKMYSAQNYYIFMEYCDSSLSDIFKQKVNNHTDFEQQEIYDIFYQCMNGYKVLFNKKILHQDIKPGNILVKNKTIKLADFGLSVFYQNHLFGGKRQGSLCYMPLQKLTKADYVGDPKSDVYSFGVMFYELITKRHPYVNTKSKKLDMKQFILQLYHAKLICDPSIPNRYSLQFLQFQSIIYRMLSKSLQNRISFQQLYTIINTHKLFQKSRQHQKQLTKSFLIQQFDFLITQISNVITMQPNISTQQQKQLRKNFEQHMATQKQKQRQTINNIYKHFVQRRRIVFYLDKLQRALQMQHKNMQVKISDYERSILYLNCLCKLITFETLQQQKSSQNFSNKDFKAFIAIHSESKQIIQLLKRDYEYIQNQFTELLQSSELLKKDEIKLIFHLYKQKKIPQIVQNLERSLVKILQQKTEIIGIKNRICLLLLFKIFTMITVIRELDGYFKKVQELDAVYKYHESSDNKVLAEFILKECQKLKIICTFDMTEEYNHEEGVMAFQEERQKEEEKGEEGDEDQQTIRLY